MEARPAAATTILAAAIAAPAVDVTLTAAEGKTEVMTLDPTDLARIRAAGPGGFTAWQVLPDNARRVIRCQVIHDTRGHLRLLTWQALSVRPWRSAGPPRGHARRLPRLRRGQLRGLQTVGHPRAGRRRCGYGLMDSAAVMMDSLSFNSCS